MFFGSMLFSQIVVSLKKMLYYIYTPSTTNVAVNSAPSSPTNVCVSPDNTSIYITSSNDLYTYTRNTTTGYLTSQSPISMLAAQGVVVSPDGLFAYAYQLNGNSIHIFNRNATTGILTLATSVAPAASANLKGLVISPDGTTIYSPDINNYLIYIFVRNTSTGLITSQSSMSFTAPVEFGIAVSPDSNFVYIVNSTAIYQFSRNTSTGALTALSPTSIAATSSESNVSQIVISSDGKFLYTIGGSHISMFSRNISTGVLTALSTPTFTNPSPLSTTGMCLSSDSSNMYLVTGANQVWEINRDLTTGLLSLELVSSFIASQSGTVLTVTSVISGTVTLGAVISNSTYATTQGWYISSFGTGSGSTGTYNMNSNNNIASTTWNVYNLSNLTTNTTLGSSNTYCIAITSDGLSVYTTDSSGNVFEFSRQ